MALSASAKRIGIYVGVGLIVCAAVYFYWSWKRTQHADRVRKDLFARRTKAFDQLFEQEIDDEFEKKYEERGLSVTDASFLYILKEASLKARPNADAVYPKIWVSLTSTPKRLHEARAIIETWDLRGVAGVILHLPSVLKRDGTPYPTNLASSWSALQKNADRVLVHACGEDFGPLTKYAGVALLMQQFFAQKKVEKKENAEAWNRAPQSCALAVTKKSLSTRELLRCTGMTPSDIFVIVDDDMTYGEAFFLSLATDLMQAESVYHDFRSSWPSIFKPVVLGNRSVMMPNSKMQRAAYSGAFEAGVVQNLAKRIAAPLLCKAPLLEGWRGIAMRGERLQDPFLHRAQEFINASKTCFNSDDLVFSAVMHEQDVLMLSTETQIHSHTTHLSDRADALHAQHWFGHVSNYLPCGKAIAEVQQQQPYN